MSSMENLEQTQNKSCHNKKWRSIDGRPVDCECGEEERQNTY